MNVVFRSFALTCLFLAGCSATVTEKDAPDSAPASAGGNVASGPPPALVRVREVRREGIAPRVVAVGTVRPLHFSVIASAADGVVDEFDQEAGTFVTKDTVLSRLRMFSTDLALDQQRAILAERSAEYSQVLEPRREDVEEARAQQLAAEAAFSNAERRLNELRNLASRGATNPSAVEDAQLILNEMQQRLLAAKAVFQRVSAGAREEEKLQAKARLDAQEKHVAWLEAEKEKRITRAPFDGFIVQEQTYLGQWLSKGAAVATMAQLHEVDVEVPIDQTFISQVSVGTKVQVKVSGTPDPSSKDGQWTGTVHSIVPRSDWEQGSRSFPVIVRITNSMKGPESAPVPTLREGMMAEVEFFGQDREAILVPKDALVRTSRGTFVFALNPAEADKPLSVSQVMVEPGISEAEWIEVASAGLSAGMQVVTEGAERLRPFQSVSVMPESAEQ